MEEITTALAEAHSALEPVSVRNCTLSAAGDAALLAAVESAAALQRDVDLIQSRLASEVAHRSRPELGHSGLAARRGAVNANSLIASLSRFSRAEAAQLIRVGDLITGAGDSPHQTSRDHPDTASSPSGGCETGTTPWEPLVDAVWDGRLGVEGADRITRTLAPVLDQVDPDLLRDALDILGSEAAERNVDDLDAMARGVHDTLDRIGVTGREQHLRSQRGLKRGRVIDGAPASEHGSRPGDGCDHHGCDRSGHVPAPRRTLVHRPWRSRPCAPADRRRSVERADRVGHSHRSGPRRSRPRRRGDSRFDQTRPQGHHLSRRPHGRGGRTRRGASGRCHRPARRPGLAGRFARAAVCRHGATHLVRGRGHAGRARRAWCAARRRADASPIHCCAAGSPRRQGRRMHVRRLRPTGFVVRSASHRPVHAEAPRSPQWTDRSRQRHPAVSATPHDPARPRVADHPRPFAR